MPATGVRPPLSRWRRYAQWRPWRGCRRTAPSPCVHALRHQLHVAAVMARDHGVGDHARQQRLDGRKDGDGDAVGKLVAEQVQAELGELQRRQAPTSMVYRSPMVSTCRPNAGTMAAPTITATSEPGMRLDTFGHSIKMARHTTPTSTACQFTVEMLAGRSAQLVRGVDGGGAGGIRQPQQILDLADQDGHRDTRREAGGDGVGNETDERAELQQAHERRASRRL